MVPDDTTVPSALAGEGRNRRTLVVMIGDVVTIHELPATGAVELGRAADAQLRVDHPSISRRHLKIWLGDRVAVEELGSANGTTLRGAALPAGKRVEIGGDEVLVAGDVALVVQQRGKPAAASRSAPSARPSGAVTSSGVPVIMLDPAMIRLRELATRVARGRIAVLIVGETGAGKELLAELIHRESPRAHAPLIRVNCAALTETLVESEVFGHEKGAFTGAVAARRGLLEAADGGTVMLDEVGELPLAIQAKLLRVVEDGAVMPVGATTARAVDVRIVAATNRDLEVEVAERRFRQDLYFRLAGVVLEVPPLRDRPAEVEVLARGFLERAAAGAGRTNLRLGDAALAQLRRHTWPGNVRELRSAMERAALIAPGDVVTPADLDLRGTPAPGPAFAPAPAATDERQRILDALEACAGNQSRAAELLGMPRRTLVKRLAEYRIPRPRR